MTHLFFHAHPDDETLSSGAIILDLIRQGEAVTVLTATRGERGEASAEVAAQLEGTELVAYRLAERAQALTTLGCTDAGFLGTQPNRQVNLDNRIYSDSGMTWLTPTLAGPDPAAPANALSLAPLAEVVADLVAALTAWSADVVVSYNAQGGYGHPDHIRCHEAAQLAARQLSLPFAEIIPADQMPSPGPGQPSPAAEPGLVNSGSPSPAAESGRPGSSPGTPNHLTPSPAAEPGQSGSMPGHGSTSWPPADGECRWYEAGEQADRLLAAHQAYLSQFRLTSPTTLVHVGGQTDQVQTRAGLRFRTG